MIFNLLSFNEIVSQCSCVNCPINNIYGTGFFAEESDIIVSGLTNPTLNVNGQAICEVRLNFFTDSPPDLRVTLQTPSGDQIELISDQGSLNFNRDLTFDISFVPCNTTATPDAGFSSTFNSLEFSPFVLQTYNGSYYPEDGNCLEDLTGDANGTYTLILEDNIQNFNTDLLDWEIIFCDGTGINCGPPLSCMPGEIISTSPASILECEGDPALNLNTLGINWNGTPPDPAAYGITYFIQDAAGNVIERTSSLDLTAYAIGTYTICAMSYLLTDEPLLPATTGGYNISQVVSDIQNDVYCAFLATNCSEVIIEQDNVDPIVSWPMPSEICEGVLVSIPIANYDPAATYIITINSGSFNSFSQDPITGNIELNAIAGVPISLCVSIDGDCDQGEDCAIIDVLPGAPVPTLSGPQGICVGNDATIIVTNFTGSEVYNWTISGPGTIAFNNNDNVIINGNGVGTVTVCSEVSNACGIIDECIMIEIIDPAPPATNANQIYCMPGGFFAGNPNGSSTSMLWMQISGPGTITFVNPNVVATGWTASMPGIYTVRLTKTNNGCVTFVESTFEVLPAPAPIVLLGPTQICEGDFGNVGINNPDPSLTYIWSISGPGIISADNITNVDFESIGIGNIEICVDATGPCGMETECFDIIVNGALPPINLSSPTFCMPGGLLDASANGPITSSLYTQISGPGTIVFSDPSQLTTDFTVDVAGIYTIELVNTYMGCEASIQFDIEVFEAPMLATNLFCVDGQFIAELTFSGGTSPYFVDGVMIAGNVFVSPSFPSGAAVLFNYEDDNGCGDQFLAQEFCPCDSDAGTMDITPIALCGSTMSAIGIHNNDENLDGNDASSYILHTQSGNTLGTIIDQNTTGTFSFLPAMTFGQTYYISLVVGNDIGGNVDLTDACLSVAIGTPVVWSEIPIITLPQDINSCDLINQIAVIASPTSTFFWSFAANSPSNNGTITQNTPSDILFFANEAGEFILEVEATSFAGCIETDQISVTVFPDIDISNVVETCNGQSYNVTFNIDGGLAPFYVNGNAIAGTSFTSANIGSGTPYSFEVQDFNGCFSNVISGSKNCNCEGDAGSMNVNQLSICDTISSIQGIYNNDGSLDVDDIGLYYLHTDNGPSLGTIIDINSTGIFDFVTGLMIADQTYYISYVVGNDDGSGSIDLQDPCLDVSVGQPVVWYTQPSIDFDPSYYSCTDTVAIAIDPFTVNYKLLNGPGIVTFESQSSDSIFIAFSESGDYIIELINAANGCEVSDTAIVRIASPISNEVIYECNTDNPTFDATLIFSGDGPFMFDQQLIIDTLKFIDLPVDTSFVITIIDINSCTSDLITINTTCDCIELTHELPIDLFETCISQGSFDIDTSQLMALNEGEIGQYFIYETGTDPINDVILTLDSIQVLFELPLITNVIYEVYYASGIPNGSGNVNLQDPCVSISNTQSFIFYPLPIFQTISQTEICGSSLEFDRYGGGYEYEFVVANPQEAEIQILDSTVVISANIPTMVTIKVKVGGICSDSIEYNLNFLPELILDSLESICISVDSFEVVAYLSGGIAPYEVNGNSYNDAIINVGTFANSTLVDLIINDDNGCDSIKTNTTSNCACPGDPGSWNNDLIRLCVGQDITFSFDNLPDVANVLSQIILIYEGSKDSIENVLAELAGLNFSYLPGYPVYDTIYAVSVIGPLVNGSIDLSDPCTQLSPAIPIVWELAPSISVAYPFELCIDEVGTIELQLNSNQFPLDVQVTINGVVENIVVPNADTVVIFNGSSTTDIIYDVKVLNTPCDVSISDIILVEDCSCITYDFNMPSGLCAIDSIDLGMVVDYNYMAEWIVQSGDATIENGILILDGSFEGEINLLANPIDPDACDTIYEFILEVESSIILELLEDQSNFCSDQDLDLNLDSELSANSINNGEWISVQGGANLINGSIVQIGDLDDGVYIFKYITSPQGYCEVDSIFYTITKYPQADYLITSQNPDCFDEGGIIVITSSDGSIASVNIDGALINGLDIDNLAGGVYGVELTDLNACIYNEEVTITEPDPLDVSITVEKEIIEGNANQVVTEVTGGQGPYTFQWILNGDTSDSTSGIISILLDGDIEITVFVTDVNGCTAEDFIILQGTKEKTPMVLANILSPSSSSNNVISIPAYEQIALVKSWMIFDRWGNKVFNAKDFDPAINNMVWDGTINGQAVDSGVYVYSLIYVDWEGAVINKAGDITVLR